MKKQKHDKGYLEAVLGDASVVDDLKDDEKQRLAKLEPYWKNILSSDEKKEAHQKHLETEQQSGQLWNTLVFGQMQIRVEQLTITGKQIVAQREMERQAK
jgi:hypothetical protein